MSFLIECMFGKDRDVFISITLLISLILMFPYSIVDEHEIFLSSLAVICTGCLIHLLIFGISFNEFDIKYDKGYFVAVGLIFIGDFAFLMSSIDSKCNQYEANDDGYRQCWWNNFFLNISMFFMILYTICVIIINRCYDEYNFKQWFNNDKFRLYYLIFCNVLALVYFSLEIRFYFSLYSNAFKWWYYISIFLNVLSIIISLLISYTNNSDDDNNGNQQYHHRRYSPLYSWWIINSLYALFGCVVYWNMIQYKDFWFVALRFCGQFIIWASWNVWLLTESMVPINVNQKQSYHQIIQV